MSIFQYLTFLMLKITVRQITTKCVTNRPMLKPLEGASFSVSRFLHRKYDDYIAYASLLHPGLC